MDINYIAGFLDGDGCVGLYKKQGTKTCKRGFAWQCHLSIGNTNKRILEMIQSFFKMGTICESKPKPWGKKNVFTLAFSHNEQRQILSSLLPLLQVKKSQAKLLIEALKLSKNNRFTGSGRFDKIKKNDERLEEIYQKLKSIKHNFGD